MALSRDDEVEGLGWDGGNVTDNGRDAALAPQARSLCHGSELVAIAFADLLACEFFQGGHEPRKLTELGKCEKAEI